MGASAWLLSRFADEGVETSTDAAGESHISCLFSFVSKLLETNLPRDISAPSATSTTFDAALEMLRSLRIVLRSTPAYLALSRLSTLEDGLLPWLHDETEALSDECYNDYVSTQLFVLLLDELLIFHIIQLASLYVAVIAMLDELEPSSSTLSRISHFLVSGFTHVPSPLICPNAFQTFWSFKYKPISATLFDAGEVSDELKVCLRYFVYTGASSESFAIGLSAGIESNTQVSHFTCSMSLV